jgi:hypothetical protein
MHAPNQTRRPRKLTKALVAGIITVGGIAGTIATTTAPAHAAMSERCAAAEAYGNYADERWMSSAVGSSEARFWLKEWATNYDWMESHGC